ncbi:uncharacterized protein LOC111565838 isoform X2 [Amphiprion ocellaris]|uniref:uncharacterized protein LOC111565838 isoform X2 n=1 Tax=Amphiprion ocellaris TaxID=80972 RepID=UPI0024117C19|nr:uncharacterized protein LOC111565838 isoform X2 [Amphiprion ocellaris]
MCEEADNSSKKKKGFFKKPDEGLWYATSMVLIYAVWCALVLILAASGQLWNNQSLGCGLNTEEIQTFQKKYLPLLPFTDTIKNPWSNGGILTEMNCWQTQFKCCGLQGFQDWNTTFPDSCFYDEEQDNNWVGTSLLPRRNIYEKACFPTITSLVEKRSSAVWIITIVWLTVIAAPFVIFALGAVVMCFVGSCLICEVSYKLSVLKYRICGGEKMVPVVFIRKNNNNQKEKEDVEAKETVWEDGVILEGVDDNPLRMIPVSLLRRLQEELDPPPVQHQVQNSHYCLMHSSNATRKFYTVLIEDGSPLLPSDAVLVESDKPTRFCCWEEGHKDFDVKDIVWPKDRLNRSTPC